MKNEGPALEYLLRRLEEMPADFLEPPAEPGKDGLAVRALIADTCRRYGIPVPASDTETHRGESGSLAALACWLLQGEEFEGLIDSIEAKGVHSLFDEILPQFAHMQPARMYLSDPERREELIRQTLKQCGLRPAGETTEQAQDRLTAINGLERQRLLDSSRDSQRRSRQIRDALVKKAAREAADKMSRE